MNYRYTQKDIKIIDVNNTNDWMYNWIRKHSGRVKLEDVTTNENLMCEYSGLPNVESYNSGSSDSNTHSTYSKETEYCTKHSIRLNSDNVCSVCMETNNK